MEKDGQRTSEDDGTDEDADLDEDEEYLKRADRFEADYNFRFQARRVQCWEQLLCCISKYCSNIKCLDAPASGTITSSFVA